VRLPRQSLVIALTLLTVLVLWVASGHLFRGDGGSAEMVTPADNGATPVLRLVGVTDLSATEITRALTNQGQTEPRRSVVVRAETAGTVEEILVARGSRVQAGEALVRLRLDTREVQLREARAELQQREADFNAARDLAREGFQTSTALRQAEAALERARAGVRAAELERERMTIRAPYDGILNNRMVEIGDYVAVNTEIARVVDNNPLVVAIDVTQEDIIDVQPGQQAEVRLRNGDSRTGVVRYTSSTADTGTRTFRVEVEVDNAESPWLAGLSAQVTLPVASLLAQQISPALLSLDDGNNLVVKTVNGDNAVEEHRVEIIRNEATGIWVTGLPERARVITAGQGFVSRGQQVSIRETGNAPATAVTD